jgi:UDP-2,4-diacetamido-2,4,6-trideoxy-beta-L-altropyranose hydrolase
MIILVRADANHDIGTGHVMRCAALGMRLAAARGVHVHFACAELPPLLGEWLQIRGLRVHMLPNVGHSDWRADLQQAAAVAAALGGVDLLVVDHYGLGIGWEQGMRPHARRILVIDDLADRDHDCDLLLDQNLRKQTYGRYAGRLPPGTRQFLGPRFALLRDEFEAPGLLRTRDGTLRNLLVFFGGTDPGNQNLKAIEALRLLGHAAPATVMVLGLGYGDPEKVHDRAQGLACLTILNSTDSMAALMAQADLAIGTCGVAAWERCVLGLPSLVVITAENQREDAEILHRKNALVNLGDAASVNAESLAEILHQLILQPERVCAMGHAASAIMQGRQASFAKFEESLLAGLS